MRTARLVRTALRTPVWKVASNKSCGLFWTVFMKKPAPPGYWVKPCHASEARCLETEVTDNISYMQTLP